MTASNVRPFAQSVNPSTTTIEDVCTWTNLKAERGEIAANSARLRVTALRALTSVLAPEEPRDAASVLGDLQNIARRWATLHSGMKGDTARTYESRAKSAIDDYLAWTKDPTGFKFTRRDTASRTDAGQEKAPARKPKPAPSTPVDHAPPPPPPPSNSGSMRSFPLGKDKGEFVFRLPDEITINDVKKIALHLATYATDFDPSVPGQVQVFDLAIRGDR